MAEDEKKATLHISLRDCSSKNLDARIETLRGRDKRLELEGRTAAILFLRATAARASQMLPALYMHMSSSAAAEVKGTEYWKLVQASSASMSSLYAISLGCRAIFDDSMATMTGKRFANVSDATLASVAKYWAEKSKKPVDDATKALVLLRALFGRCARAKKLLLSASSLLERRVGLLKYHADREAAHITLEEYVFETVDLIHVVAALTIVGAVILGFDDITRGDRYFDEIDEAGWQAAKATFPDWPVDRLFDGFAIRQQASAYWKLGEAYGLEMLLNRLPAAIGYWDSEDDEKTPVI